MLLTVQFIYKQAFLKIKSTYNKLIIAIIILKSSYLNYTVVHPALWVAIPALQSNTSFVVLHQIKYSLGLQAADCTWIEEKKCFSYISVFLGQYWQSVRAEREQLSWWNDALFTRREAEQAGSELLSCFVPFLRTTLQLNSSLASRFISWAS